ncbi:MAG: hypothetical protein O6909_10015, partial [Alphaproteobacteria bacterium]|nr:hypothetical protein [Alphaproteobacteria bacterium]
MADDNILDGETNTEEEQIIDQPAGDEHSAFMDDEELHDQLPNEGESDDRTALTAAHQGSRATSTPADSSGAFAPAADAVLPDDASDRARSQTNSANRSFGDAISDNPVFDILGSLDSVPSTANGDAAQNAHEDGGRGSATAAERNPSAAETADANAADGQLLDGGDSDQDSTDIVGSDGVANEDLSLSADLTEEV